MFHMHIQRKNDQLNLNASFALGLMSLWFIVPQLGSAATPTPTSISLEAGFHQMYNLDFSAAHKTFEEWEGLHPDDPLGAASNAAAYLFAEFDRLHILEFDLFTDNRRIEEAEKQKADPANKSAFESELAKADQIAEKALSQSSDDRNALFAKTLADGLRGNYAALIENRKRDALGYLKSSRTTAEKLITIDPAYYDAYLAIGIENYLLGLRSAPSRWVLRLTGAETNKEKGLSNLKMTADKGSYLAPYARVLLVIASLRDHDRETAKRILAALARDFPQNRLYQIELARLRG
jgi:hypothetical protein